MNPIFETISSYPEEKRLMTLAGVSFLAALGLIPTTTDIVLVVAGILLHENLLNPLHTLFICYFTIASAETLMFEFGIIFGSRVMRSRFIAKMMPPEKIEALKFKLTGPQVNLVRSIRFNPILRPLQILCLASLKANRQEYYGLSYLFLLIYVPIVIYSTVIFARFVPIQPEWIVYFLLILMVINLIYKRLRKVKRAS